jgi:predicted DNA-binding transcriptional regulator YafY
MTQSQRILKIMQMLFDKQSINTQTLSEYFQTDKRSIQRDIKLLKNFFGDQLYQLKRGEYILQNPAQLYNHLQKSQQTREMRAFFEFITLFDDKLLSIFDQEEFPMITQIRRETKAYYHILENPIETLDKRFLPQIKEAIANRRYADLTLCEIKPKDLKMIKPIKIVFAEGNWYLAAMTQNYKANHGFKFFRINFITNFKLHPRTFQREIEAEKFIEDFQSLFQYYKTPTYEVKLRVNAQVARYFKVKKFLKSQRIVETKANGDLILTYQINDPMEVIPLIKKWLPHIRVISPKALDDQIREEIRTYLDTSMV